jgi:Tfp pilus assembly protein FimT
MIAVATPRILQQVDSQRLYAAARQIAGHIRYARERAMAREVRDDAGTNKVQIFKVIFWPYGSGNRYQVFKTDDDNPTGSIPVKNPFPPTSDDLEVDFDTAPNLKGVEIDSTTFTGDEVRFDYEGTPSEGGDVNISLGSHQRTISVEANTGRVSIQ